MKSSEKSLTKTSEIADFYKYLAPSVIFSKEPDAVINYMKEKECGDIDGDHQTVTHTRTSSSTC